MEIRIQNPPAPIPFLSIAKPGEERDGAQAQRRVPPPVEAKTDNKARAHSKNNDKPVVVREKPELQKPQRFRLELRIDDNTKKVFGRVIDKESGEKVREIPAESIRQLQAISRELFGSLIDEKV